MLKLSDDIKITQTFAFLSKIRHLLCNVILKVIT